MIRLCRIGDKFATAKWAGTPFPQTAGQLYGETRPIAIERKNTMNIAIMAHDNKKELMVQFCIAYCGILSEHTIFATATTGRMVSEATGLSINMYLSAAQGGSQQIRSRIAYNEIDLVLFFWDPSSSDAEAEAEVVSISRACDQHSIPFASNVATAEVLIQGLKRGDLGWRDIVNPKK